MNSKFHSMFESTYIAVLILTGIGVGFATGLLGVGGGFLLAPLIFFLLQSLGFDSDISIRTAFGTSLAVILPTAISGSYRHYHHHCVRIRPALFMGVAGFIGGMFGGFLATQIPADYLRIIFGCLLIGISIQLLRLKELNIKKKSVEDYTFFFWGLLAGIASGLLGIGGGVILVPIMALILGFRMIEAVGTSTLVIVFTSIGGVIAYIFFGLNVTGLPPYSFGYINLLQLVILSGFSIPLAQLGAWSAHRIPEKYLRYVFIVLLLYLALKMLDVFVWLRIPI